MSYEIEAALPIRIVYPSSYCERRQTPIVCFSSRLKVPATKKNYIQLNVNVNEREEDLQSWSWALVHATVSPGTDAADADLDVMSIRPLDDTDIRPPTTISTTGEVINKLTDNVGRWIILRVGVNEESDWTVS